MLIVKGILKATDEHVTDNGAEIISKNKIFKYWLERNKDVNRYRVMTTLYNAMSNFHKLLEITAPEDKKTLLQLIINKITIKNKKDIDSIELHFDEKAQKYFINNKEGESSDDGGSSFILFTIKV
ncbi:hypothetical protein N4T77_00775 [Clostridium sp. CX1]|uniref:hypothetical protein n=1 Tax=Clostridium sp. CX1 TaxID=2978346 RepID=UPI0021C24567|nr:hypothetical protein [Clostridium sp. CX1]MCT8975124.1 hypothetical protein [Clostridium sp. CX1]